MSVVTPIVTFVLFLLGIVVWQLQLVAKRRFEVAEQALAAFHKAADALSMMRSRILRAEERVTIEVPKDLSEEDQERLRDYNVYAERAQAAASDFAELRTAQILAKVHFGQPAEDAMNVLLGGRWKVMYAARELHLEPPFRGEGGTARALLQHRDFLVSMRRVIGESRSKDGAPADTDELSKEIDAARRKLENACQPALTPFPWLEALAKCLRKLRVLN
jgi:hypothetical protein